MTANKTAGACQLAHLVLAEVLVRAVWGWSEWAIAAVKQRF